MQRCRRFAIVSCLLLAPLGATAKDVPFLESPKEVVEAMLELAAINDSDVVYDLGSGDGRLVIAAAEARDVRGVGVEIDAELVALSNRRAVEAGVEDRVEFVEADLFETDFSEASVVLLYLYPKVNRRLQPILAEQLAPGTRVVSHRYEIPGWKPERRIKVLGRPIFLYVVPDHGPLW